MEAQEAPPSSLLNWVREVLRVRKQHPALWMGKLRFVNPSNRRVMAFVRSSAEETLLCVCNLARGAQPAELDLSEWQGWTPLELFAGTPFPTISDRPYQLSLGACFYWFRCNAGARSRHECHPRGAHRLARTPARLKKGVPISKVEGAPPAARSESLKPRPAARPICWGPRSGIWCS